MPRDINARLENLRSRRKGIDAVAKGRVTASFAEDVTRQGWTRANVERSRKSGRATPFGSTNTRR